MNRMRFCMSIYEIGDEEEEEWEDGQAGGGLFDPIITFSMQQSCTPKHLYVACPLKCGQRLRFLKSLLSSSL